MKWEGLRVSLLLGGLLLFMFLFLGTAVSYANYGVEAQEKISAQQATIARLRDDITVLEGEVAETSDSLSDCEYEAQLWQDVSVSMLAAFQSYLAGYTLDMGDATSYIDDANELGCI